jgi:CRP-like cAMP-binding protein
MRASQRGGGGARGGAAGGAGSAGPGAHYDEHYSIERLTAFTKALAKMHATLKSNRTQGKQEHQTADKVVEDLRGMWDEMVLEPLAQTMMAAPKPDSAAAVIRFALAQLGNRFTAAQMRDQISKSGFAPIVHEEFMDELSVVVEGSLLSADEVLSLFYKTHKPTTDDAGQRKNEEQAVEGWRVRYTEVAEMAAEIERHSLFRSTIMLLIMAIVVLTAMSTYRTFEDAQWIKVLEAIIVSVFALEVILKLVACGLKPLDFFYVHITEHEREFTKAHHSWHYYWQEMIWILTGVQGWNLFDLAIVIICLPISPGGDGMAVLRLLRVVKLLQLLMQVQQIRVVVSGLASGLNALFYIMIIFSIIFYVYGLAGMMAFGEDDHFHFGTLARAFVTMFRMSMGPWQDTMRINLYGCLDARAHLPTQQIQRWYCNPAKIDAFDSDNTRAALVTLYFLSFKVICEFVALSCLFGVITTSMSRALATTNEKKFVEMRVKRSQAAQKELERKRQTNQALKKVSIASKYKMVAPVQGTVRVRMEKQHGTKGKENLTKPVNRRITVEGAADLIMADGSRDNPQPSDPYAVVYWEGHEVLRTPYVLNTCDPVWSEHSSVLIQVDPSGGNLRLELFDWDNANEKKLGGVRQDDFLGEAQVIIGGDETGFGGQSLDDTVKDLVLKEHRKSLKSSESVREFDLFSKAAKLLVQEGARDDGQNALLLQLLQGIHWFYVHCPNPAALRQVANLLSSHQVKKNTVLFKQGDKADKMYIVLEGEVTIHVGGSMTARLGVGATLGERALRSPGDTDYDETDVVRYTTVKTVTDCICAVVARDEYVQIADRALVEGETVDGVAEDTVASYRRMSLQIFEICESRCFHFSILFCICLAALLLGIEVTLYEQEEREEQSFLVFINTLLLCIFTTEVVLKFIATCNSWQSWHFLTDAWTQFDTVIVILCWIPFAGPGVAVARMLRLVRIMKEFKSMPQLQMIINGLADAVAGRCSIDFYKHTHNTLITVKYCFANNTLNAHCRHMVHRHAVHYADVLLRDLGHTPIQNE